MKALSLLFLFLSSVSGHANVFFDEFKLLHSQGAMRDPQKVVGFFERLENISSFESMAVLYYLADVGFEPSRLEAIDPEVRPTAQDITTSQPWIEVKQLRSQIKKKAREAIQLWVEHHSASYDLYTAGAIARAWHRSPFELHQTPEKLFALFLLSDTPIGRWDFVSTTEMRLPEALLEHLKDIAKSDVDGNANFSKRMQTIHSQVLLALSRQLQLMPRKTAVEFHWEFYHMEFASRVFFNLLQSVGEQWKSKKAAEAAHTKRILRLLTSVTANRPLDDNTNQRLGAALDDLNTFWQIPDPTIISELRRIHAGEFTRNDEELSRKIRYHLQVLSALELLVRMNKIESKAGPQETLTIHYQPPSRPTPSSCFALLLEAVKAQR